MATPQEREHTVESEDGSVSAQHINMFESPDFQKALREAVAKAMAATQPNQTNQDGHPSTSQSSSNVVGAVASTVGSAEEGTSSHTHFTAPSFMPVVPNATPVSASSCSVPTNPTATSNAQGAHQGLERPGIKTPFSLGPGHTPIPPKIVGEIVAGKYIDLADLLAENLDATRKVPHTFILAGDQMIQSTTAPRKQKEIVDIVTWVECFVSYMSVVTAYNPARSRDLLLYLSLILRTSRRFGGNAWRNYDKAFRQDAAATGLTNWGEMHTALYNYHTAGATTSHQYQNESRFRATEARGSTTSAQICYSWNKGRCISRGDTCQFSHVCQWCSQFHRGTQCYKKRDERQARQRSRSPARRRDKRE